LPTITSVSRQAVFAGNLYFPSSIYKTDKEAILWRQFWFDQGLTLVGVAYAKGLGEALFLKWKKFYLIPKLERWGWLSMKWIRLYGMELGTAGMHNQVRQWALQGFIAQLLDLLQPQLQSLSDI